MIADVQALTDNFNNPEKVRNSVKQLCIDYLSCGIDPQKQQYLFNQWFLKLQNLQFSIQIL